MSHAFLAPSAASCWVECPGSAAMSAMIPETKSEAASAGDAAHWLCQMLLEDCVNGEYANLNIQQYLGQTDPAGTIITPDMGEAAAMYVEEIAFTMDSVGWDKLFIESHVSTPIHEECHGTPDAYFYEVGIDTMHIWDFKYGHGDVAAFENWQLICYYAGAMESYGFTDPTALRVDFCIVQPRCFTASGPVKKWSVAASELGGALSRLREAAAEAVKPTAPVVSGNQCRYCPARHMCKSARESALDAISYQNTMAPEPLSDDGLAYEMSTLQNAIKALKHRESALHDEASARIATGRKIPNFSRVSTVGNRKFNADPAVLAMIAPAGVVLLKDPEAVSPAEAERRLKKSGKKPAEIAAMLDGLIDRPNTGTKVVMDKGTEARRIFSQL